MQFLLADSQFGTLVRLRTVQALASVSENQTGCLLRASEVWHMLRRGGERGYGEA